MTRSMPATRKIWSHDLIAFCVTPLRVMFSSERPSSCQLGASLVKKFFERTGQIYQDYTLFENGGP